MRQSPGRIWPILLGMLGLMLFPASGLGQMDSSVQKVQSLEKEGRWQEACSLYEASLARDRGNLELRQAYQRSLRHFRQTRRLEDEGLQTWLSKLTPAEALDLYDQVLRLVVHHYPDRDRTRLEDLFREGLHELSAALDDRAFVSKHLSRVSLSQLESFRDQLQTWESRKVSHVSTARQLLREILQAGASARIFPGLIGLECACGVCNSLDEYSLYLMPSRLSHAQAQARGKLANIGLEVSAQGGKLEISRVQKRSPADLAGLTRGDRLLRIDGEEPNPQAPELLAEKLFGEPGTLIELEYVPRGGELPLTVKLERLDILPVSVEDELRGEMGNYVGYLHIFQFQESTLQEVKEALLRWQGMPLRGIIVDLRGNPGGMLRSALGVAELFLPEAVLAHTQSPFRELSRTYRSHNGSPNLLPLIVLVDGETASAAEVLAAALKENGRALLVGQATFGKGSIQSVIPLERSSGGVRLTVAKLTSPTRVPLSGRGIVPDHVPLEGEGDMALKTAEQLLLRMMPR